ncbi:hypothetical protein K504DRAFT_386844, partial [Pleomassaria siparia CBS 279.74]
VVNLDNINRLIPISALSKLLIKGPLLLRSYLNNSVKTAAAFIIDPAFILNLYLSLG